MQWRAEKRVELEVLLSQHLADHMRVVVGKVQNADLGTHVRDLIDDVLRSCLANGELVFIRFERVDHLDEGLDREHVMLCGDGAQLLARFRVLVPFLQQIRLVEHLPRIGEEFRAVDGQRNALRGA